MYFRTSIYLYIEILYIYILYRYDIMFVLFYSPSDRSSNIFMQTFNEIRN